MSQPVRKRKKKSKNQYFTQATEDAIVRYNESTDFEERSEIYRKEIHYAFFKLTENIIHTFKFYTYLINHEVLKHFPILGQLLNGI
jgi:vesicle coat complex subunit